MSCICKKSAAAAENGGDPAVFFDSVCLAAGNNEEGTENRHIFENGRKEVILFRYRKGSRSYELCDAKAA